MELDISSLDGTKFGLRVRGEIDLDSVGQLRHFIAALPRGEGPLVVEASEVDFIDSTGLNLLIQLAATGSPGVVIRNPSRAVRRLLEVALPGGMPGMWVDFSGAGPGAAHRLSELLRSTVDLRSLVSSEWFIARSTRRSARRLRLEHAALAIR